MNNNSEQKTYTFSDIRRYLDGGMTASEMHDIEHASLQDPFLADALEGYDKTDAAIAAKTLNEIDLLLQSKKQPAAIISMPKKRNFTWQIAASILAVIGISIFFLYKQTTTNQFSSLAMTKASSKEKKDSENHENSMPVAPLLQDSLSVVSANLSLQEKKEYKPLERNKSIVKNEATKPAKPASALPSATIEAITIASQKQNEIKDSDKATAMTLQSSNAMKDSQNTNTNSSSAFASRKAKAVTNNYWTTDKNKPFILSEIEEMNIGKKSKKTDTAAVKPEGGWQSFQDYLFTKLSKKDTADFINATRFYGDLELEFSVTENGLPYNVKVLHAPDSTAAKTAADALKQGPKWITSGKKEKRLKIRY